LAEFPRFVTKYFKQEYKTIHHYATQLVWWSSRLFFSHQTEFICLTQLTEPTREKECCSTRKSTEEQHQQQTSGPDCPNQTLEYDRDWASSDHSRCGPSYSTHIGWLQVKCPDPGYWFTENPITELLLKEILIVNTQLADKWKLENDWLYKFRLARCAACRFIWVGSPLYFPREMVYRYITLIWHQQRQNKQKM